MKKLLTAFAILSLLAACGTPDGLVPVDEPLAESVSPDVEELAAGCSATAKCGLSCSASGDYANCVNNTDSVECADAGGHMKCDCRERRCAEVTFE